MKIGFMQGRLCDRVDGKIQAFPWQQWQLEFPEAQRLGLGLMEWTLDQQDLYENPLMTRAGRERINQLKQAHGVEILSLTGDCFMQAPFYKVQGQARQALLDDLKAILEACAQVGIRYTLIPLVDNGSLTSAAEHDALLEGLLPLLPWLQAQNQQIVFESDFAPRQLADFIGELPAHSFGINYDIGNSAALGFDPDEELACYGERVVNVHVKDRMLGGTTVPLGSGNADFPRVFSALKRQDYQGNLILQTARAEDNRHADALARYRDMTQQWWDSHGA